MKTDAFEALPTFGGLWDDTGDEGPCPRADTPALEFPRLRSQLPVVSAESLPASLEMSALRKRIFAPAWWCEGLLVKHSAKDALTQHLGANVPGRVAIVGPALQPKHVQLLWAVWNDLVALSAQGLSSSADGPSASPAPSGASRSRLVRIPLVRHLRGTPLAVAESMRFLVDYWASPFQIVAPKSGGAGTRKGKGAASRTSSVNFVRFCTVEAAESPELILELALPLVDFVAGRFDSILPSFLCEEAFASKGHALAAGRPALVTEGVVSANPDVLRAFGTGASFRKLVAYLYVEYAKVHADDVFDSGGWQGRGVSSSALQGLHEGLLQRTKALYDHGVFGWENAAPRERVRALRTHGSVVHCWRLSPQARQATELESHLQARLFDARPLRESAAEILSLRRGATGATSSVVPAPELPRATSPLPESPRPRAGAVGRLPAEPPRSAPAARAPTSRAFSLPPQPQVTVQPQVTLQRQEAPRTQVTPQSPVPPPSHDAVARPTPPSARQGPLGLPLGVSEDDDRLFLCVLEYYASLTPGQQRMFQTQRSRMSDEEFRAYVLPLLKRRPL